MDRVYIKCCSTFSLAATNWNEAYQLALEMGDSTMQLATARQDKLRRVEKAFEEEVVQGAVRIVTMDPNAPRSVPKELLCYRDKNVFYRILPDGRSGRSIVAALRGVLQSRSALLTVPLTSVIIYRGTPVLAQALAPLGAEPMKIYGDGAEPNLEVAAEVEIMADALRTPLPDEILCEVYRGLDGRMYVTNTNVTTIALDDSMLIGGPLKRPEMLALCPCVTATCEDTLNVLRNPVVMEALRRVLNTAADQQCRHLSETLHFYGVNLCLLRGVVDAFAERYGDAAYDVQHFTEVVALEMMARTIKQEFYTEVQAKRLGIDVVGINKCYALNLRAALHSEREDRFIQLVLLKYAIHNEGGRADGFIETLLTVRRDHRSALVKRVSWLIGVRSAPAAEGAENERTVVWAPLIAGRITPHLCDPTLMCSLEPLYRSLPSCEAHYFAHCYPLQVKVALWQGRVGDGLNLARTAAEQARARYGDVSLRAVQAQRTFMRLLFTVPSLENVREAYGMVTSILEVLENCAGPITRAKCHIEVGCCLLSASAVMDVVGEAARHFRAAGQLLPASLRSSSGAWLYLQPSLGLVRCRQLDQKSGLVPLKALVTDAMYFSRVVTPADYCTEYLWELGMELAAARHYAESTHILTAAYRMAKRTQRTQLDVDRLRSDAVSAYSVCDPEKYAAYCNAISERARVA
ncbi:Clustered mitochondria/Translation initiation factor eIF3 subunit 135, putative [Leishmania donovani]|uniref:Clustered mitochondria/Translation initiation factor eIF3 subunit 135, putative n=1 Tax=Leishmania donovani TaxID=5661 RepID=A0A3S7WUD5_LEIDO|nr:Clustered mitochondria/Translation initiation factor eIF3 subunit 135, putative [Leishmania donovani]